MATSQNGYRANNRSLIASYKVPGGKISMRKGDVATVLSYVAKRFHSEVEPLKWPGNWGYAERKIRGGSSLSNHASGTAIDLNAPAHYLGARGTFSSTQLKAVRRILNDCDGVIRWGGDYSGRKDEMHFEINKGTSAVKSLANKIKAGKKPGPSGGATSGGSSGGGSSYGSASAKHEVGSRIMRKYDGGTDVYWLQRRLYKLGYDIDKAFDRLYGPTVEKAVRALQEDAGITVDGDAGPDTIAAAKAGKVKRELPTAKKPKAPVFPYGRYHYLGRESNSSYSHSGALAKDKPHVRKWQQRMKDRGWSISVDDYFGPQSERVARQFQRQIGVLVDGKVGKVTFGASWTAPIT